MRLFIEQFLNGIGDGVIFGSVALALVLIWRTTRVLNFAQGEMALFSTFLSWRLTVAGLPVVGAIAVSVVAAFVAGALIERVLIRPVEEARSPLNVVIVTLGLFLALNSLAQLVFTDEAVSMPDPFPSGSVDLFSVGGETVDVRNGTIGLLAVLLVEVAALWYLLQRTKLGLKLRAVASNPDSSRLHGINAGAMLMVGWALAATIGALAGALVASQRQGFDATLMQIVVVFALAAAALGGFDSLLGAVISGLVLGVSNALTIQYIDALEGIELVVPLGLVLVVLLVKPNGLFGKRTVERV